MSAGNPDQKGLLNALNSEDRGLKVRFSLATIAFDRESASNVPNTIIAREKPCPSFPWFFGKRRGKPPKKQGFFIPAEPLKSLEKKGKTLKKKKGLPCTRKKKTRNSKKNKERKDREKRTFKPLSSLFSAFSNLKERDWEQHENPQQKMLAFLTRGPEHFAALHGWDP